MTPAVMPSQLKLWVEAEEALGEERPMVPVEDLEIAVKKKPRKRTVRKSALGEIFDIVTVAAPRLTVARKGALAM